MDFYGQFQHIDGVLAKLEYVSILLFIFAPSSIYSVLHTCRYIACFYWGSSAGDGFDANSTYERVCAIIGQFLVVNGAGSFIIAGTIRALEEFDIEGQKHRMYRQKIDRVNDYMRGQNLPHDQRRKIRRFYHEVWVRQQLDYNEVGQIFVCYVAVQVLRLAVATSILCFVMINLLTQVHYFDLHHC